VRQPRAQACVRASGKLEGLVEGRRALGADETAVAVRARLWPADRPSLDHHHAAARQAQEVRAEQADDTAADDQDVRMTAAGALAQLNLVRPGWLGSILPQVAVIAATSWRMAGLSSAAGGSMSAATRT